MADNPIPLTDAQIRESLERQIQRYLHMGTGLAVLEKALLNKGLLTESDMNQARLEVKEEADQHFDKMAKATRKGPAGGIH